MKGMFFFFCQKFLGFVGEMSLSQPHERKMQTEQISNCSFFVSCPREDTGVVADRAVLRRSMAHFTQMRIIHTKKKSAAAVDAAAAAFTLAHTHSRTHVHLKEHSEESLYTLAATLNNIRLCTAMTIGE